MADLDAVIPGGSAGYSNIPELSVFDVWRPCLGIEHRDHGFGNYASLSIHYRSSQPRRGLRHTAAVVPK